MRTPYNAALLIVLGVAACEPSHRKPQGDSPETDAPVTDPILQSAPVEPTDEPVASAEVEVYGSKIWVLKRQIKEQEDTVEELQYRLGELDAAVKRVAEAVSRKTGKAWEQDLRLLVDEQQAGDLKLNEAEERLEQLIEELALEQRKRKEVRRTMPNKSE